MGYFLLLDLLLERVLHRFHDPVLLLADHVGAILLLLEHAHDADV